jgi:hypothetical protein
MSRFQVRFYKEVTSDTGRDFDACQGTFDIDADNEHAAVERAKQRFCGERQIRKWTVNADRLEVEHRTDTVNAE